MGFTSMFNLSRIMSDAWTVYRRSFTSYSRPANKEACRRCWRAALRSAWAWAKHEIAEAAKSEKQKAADRLAMLKAELMRFDARPWGMREHHIAGHRAGLVTQIDLLSACISHQGDRA